MNSKLIILSAAFLVIFIITILLILFIKKRQLYEYEVIEEGTKEDEVGRETKEQKRIHKNSKVKKRKREEWTGVLPNYNYYNMKLTERVLWSFVAVLIMFCVGYIFYSSVIWAAVISIVGIIYPKYKKKYIIQKRKSKLLLQFKEALYALSASLTAGKSVPMAFKDSYSDLKIIYDDEKENFMLEELQYIIRRIDRNETIEEALEDLAERSGLEDVETFADIFTSCTRTGGNLKEVIRSSSQIIGDKIEVKQEIQTIIAGKKFEAKVLTAVPIMLVLFLKISAPDFMAPLDSVQGRISCTIALIIIGIANIMARKIMNIEV